MNPDKPKTQYSRWNFGVDTWGLAAGLVNDGRKHVGRYGRQKISDI